MPTSKPNKEGPSQNNNRARGSVTLATGPSGPLRGRPAFDQLADSKALEALFYVAVLIFTLITLGLAVVLRESPPL